MAATTLLNRLTDAGLVEAEPIKAERSREDAERLAAASLD